MNVLKAFRFIFFFIGFLMVCPTVKNILFVRMGMQFYLWPLISIPFLLENHTTNAWLPSIILQIIYIFFPEALCLVGPFP